MSTIATLVAKLGLDTSEFMQKAEMIAGKMAQLAAQSSVVARAGDQVSEAWKKSATVYDQANTKATVYLKTLLGIGTASAMVANGTRHAFQVDRAKSTQSLAMTGQRTGDVSNMADAMDRLTRSTTAAWEAFGTAFSKAAGLGEFLNLLTNIVRNLTSTMRFFGTVLGTIVSVISACTPLMLALVIAAKLLSIAFAVLAFVLAKITLMLFIKWLTGSYPLMLALSAATWLWNAALSYSAIAIGILEAIGLPLFAAIAVVIAAVALIVWGLCAAWDALTASATEGTEQTAEDIKRMTEELAGAQKQLAQVGMTASQKRIDDLQREGKVVSDLEKKNIQLGEVMKAQAAIAQAKVDVQHEAQKIGMSETDKAVYDLKTQKGVTATPDMKADLDRIEAIKATNKLEEDRLDLVKQYDQTYMSVGDKELYDLEKKLGFMTDEIKNRVRANELLQQNVELSHELADAQKEHEQRGMSAAEKAADDSRRKYGSVSDEMQDKIAEAIMLKNITASTKDLTAAQNDLDWIGLSAVEKKIKALQFSSGIMDKETEALIRQTAEINLQKEITQDLINANRSVDQAGMSKAEKAIEDAKLKGPVSAQNAQDMGDVIALQSLAASRQKLLDLDHELSNVGKSAADQRIADLTRENGLMTDTEEKVIRETESKKALLEVNKQLSAAQKAAEQLGMTDAQKQMDDARREGLSEEVTAQQEKLRQLEAENKIKQEILDAQKQISQFNMSDADKAKQDAGMRGINIEAEIDKLAALKKQASVLEHINELAKEGKKGTKAEEEASELKGLKKNIDQIMDAARQGLIDPERAANALKGVKKELAKHSGFSENYESPSAILKGSAEAELAAARAKSPIQELSDLGREQLKATQDGLALAQAQIDAIKENKPPVPRKGGL